MTTEGKKGKWDGRYDCLKLENQLCFPLYACSKEVIRKYKPLLDRLDLTYTQYIAMMVLWDKKHTNVKEMGKALFLDSGTLTPLLKKLEQKGYLERHRMETDERNLMVSITKKGMELREEAVKIPEQIGSCICLKPEEAMQLYELLYKVLSATSKDTDE
ncbi:MAG: MarR family transcriptional regulator [Eubacterium sp.]|nr:MarR family transcriptional regulator [Eubacterium sp.]